MENAPGTDTPATPPRVLVCDDDDTVLTSVVRVLTRGGCDVVKMSDAREASAKLLEDDTIEVALLDVMMPHLNGLDILKNVKERRARLAVVMMTSSTSIETAVEAVKRGAFDYLSKPFESLDKIVLTVQRAAEHYRLIDRNVRLERMLEVKEQFEDLIGQSQKMRSVFEMIDSVSATPATVLIRGESGTGKELVARAIHKRSDRANKPFLAVNCSALTETLLESELFGHTKGSFTGAANARKGLFESANGGTVFLDEIGDISPQTQVSLLRVLQEGEVKPIGANAIVRVDVRVLAATNAPLEENIKKKKFREDLFYRLNVVPIALPPLRERPEDIALLALHLLRVHGRKMKRDVTGFTEAAMRMLMTHAWPGNVRELDNAVARGVVMAKDGMIDAGHLPPNLGGSVAGSDLEAASLAHLPYADAKKAALVAFERSYLTAKLKAANGNISKAAREAAVDRSNFKRLLREYGVLTDGSVAEDGPET